MDKKAKAPVRPMRQTSQYNCMTSSLAMALEANGVAPEECTMALVNKVMGARPMKGARWEEAMAAAQHYGMRATLTLPATVRQLKAWTDAGIPVMIAWNPEGRDWSHASVVFDVDDQMNVHVADPNIPNPSETVRIVSEDDFYSKWYEKWPNYLVRRPAMAIEREITPDGRQVMAKTAAGKPRSKWDKVPTNRRAFDWSTPAPNIDGSVPIPWRVVHADRALSWLKVMFNYPDLYTDYVSDKYNGQNKLWVGLRDNRDKAEHGYRLENIFDALRDDGFPVIRSRGGWPHLFLVDDLKRDGLKRASQAPTAIETLVAGYDGNPDGADIYDNEIDHGYGQPLSGGTDVMKRLQDELLHEQGSSKREPNPRLARVDEKLMERAAKLLWYMGPKDVIAHLVKEGVSKQDAYLATKAGAHLNEKREKRQRNAHEEWQDWSLVPQQQMALAPQPMVMQPVQMVQAPAPQMVMVQPQQVVVPQQVAVPVAPPQPVVAPPVMEQRGQPGRPGLAPPHRTPSIDPDEAGSFWFDDKQTAEVWRSNYYPNRSVMEPNGGGRFILVPPTQIGQWSMEGFQMVSPPPNPRVAAKKWEKKLRFRTPLFGIWETGIISINDRDHSMFINLYTKENPIGDETYSIYIDDDFWEADHDKGKWLEMVEEDLMKGRMPSEFKHLMGVKYTGRTASQEDHMSNPLDTLNKMAQGAEKDAKFPKGTPADPTVNMSPEQKAEWGNQNKIHRDKFKSASLDALEKLAEAEDSDEKDAKFEKGKPADPTVNMTPEDKAKWEKSNENNKDKFKSASFDWKRGAQKLLDENTDRRQGSQYYRAYLRAVISGDKASSSHIAKTFKEGMQAREDLIDLVGTGRFASGCECGGDCGMCGLEKMAQADTPAQAAVWHAWDVLLGVEKVRSHESFVSRVGDLFSFIETEEVLYGGKYEKMSFAARVWVESIDKQSRSWRSAYNLWREGHSIDFDRMARDLGRTLIKVQKAQKHLVRVRGVEREHPLLWETLESSDVAAREATKKAIAALERAISSVKTSGKSASGCECGGDCGMCGLERMAEDEADEKLSKFEEGSSPSDEEITKGMSPEEKAKWMANKGKVQDKKAEDYDFIQDAKAVGMSPREYREHLRQQGEMWDATPKSQPSPGPAPFMPTREEIFDLSGWVKATKFAMWMAGRDQGADWKLIFDWAKDGRSSDWSKLTLAIQDSLEKIIAKYKRTTNKIPSDLRDALYGPTIYSKDRAHPAYQVSRGGVKDAERLFDTFQGGRYIVGPNGRSSLPEWGGKTAANAPLVRDLKRFMRKFDIPGKVSGRSTQWAVEVPDDDVYDLFLEKWNATFKGFGFNASKSGNGGWMIRAEMQSDPMDDFNNPASRHHYAKDKTAASRAGDGLRFRDKYLDMFFSEKDLPIVWWNLKAQDGTPHTMSNQTVLEFLVQAPSREKKGVGNMIRKIDFKNGDVNLYLKHLAGALINGPLAPKMAAGTVDLWAATHSLEGALVGVTESPSGSNPRYWNKAAGGDTVEVHRLADVPVNVAERLVDFGTKAPQAFRDGKQAWQVASRFSQRGRSAGDLDGMWGDGVGAKKAARAPSGLYGFTRKTQSDVEASIRKLQRKATAIAKAAYKKDVKVATFLGVHAKRSKSPSARALVAALKNLGPKVAAAMAGEVYEPVRSIGLGDKVAELVPPEATGKTASGNVNSRYLRSITPQRKAEILKAVARHYGVSVREMEVELVDPDAEELYEYLAFDNGMAMQVYREFQRGRFASTKEAVSYGMYGYKSKTATLGLNACALMKGAAGTVSADLHRRRSAKHAKITAYLSMHGKTARCQYARMLNASYPDSTMRLAATQPPKTVDEWIAWDEE